MWLWRTFSNIVWYLPIVLSNTSSHGWLKLVFLYFMRIIVSKLLNLILFWCYYFMSWREKIFSSRLLNNWTIVSKSQFIILRTSVYFDAIYISISILMSLEFLYRKKKYNIELKSFLKRQWAFLLKYVCTSTILYSIIVNKHASIFCDKSSMWIMFKYRIIYI